MRDKSGDRYFPMIHGDATFGIPNGDRMVEFGQQMLGAPDELKAEAERLVDERLSPYY